MAESPAIRSFSVLEMIVRADAPLSLDDATQLAGLPKATMFRILTSLHGAGLLRRDPSTKRYAVGPRLTSLAIDMWRQSTLRAQWHQALQRVVDVIDESVNLTILEGREVLYLDRVETKRPLRLHLEPGTRVPLHCTASGKLFLSQMSKEQVRALLGPSPLPKITSRTIRDYPTLERELEKVRRTQVGTHDSEMFEDSVAIAVPVCDAAGRIFAAVAVHAPSSRMSIRTCLDHVGVLKQAADEVSRSMTGSASASSKRASGKEAAKPAASPRTRRRKEDAPLTRTSERSAPARTEPKR